MQVFFAKDNDGVKVDSEIHQDVLADGDKNWSRSDAQTNTLKYAIDVLLIDKDLAHLLYK